MRFHIQVWTYQFKALPFGLSTAPMKFTVVAKEVKLMVTHKGIRIHQYLDDWLVRARSHQVCLQHTQDLVKMCQELGWLVNSETGEIRTGSEAGFQLCRLPVRSQVQSGLTHTGLVAEPSRENTETAIPTGLSVQTIHVLDRSVNSQRETSSLRSTSYETHTVASQKQLEGSRITGKGDPNSQVPAPQLIVVARRRQCTHRPAITPHKTCSANLYRCIKRRVGRSLKRAHWSLPENKMHINYLELKAVFLALKEFQDLCSDKIVLVATDTTVVSYINKEGGMTLDHFVPYYGES